MNSQTAGGGARTWTPAQLDAIEAREGPLLVSAAAGSGKTAVLVERAISLICDGQNPVDADRLLIVTYTNAAAAEMKQRIGARLSQLARQNPDDMRLVRQQTLLSRAPIGTIHSFCLELVRQNFQHLPIAPDFTLAGEGELEILRQETARDVVELFYQNDEDGSFSDLVELLSSSRDDGRLIEIMLKLYDFARSHSFFEQWLEETYEKYAEPLPIEETGWGQTLLRYGKDTLEHCVSKLSGAIAIMESQGDDGMLAAYGGAIASDIAQCKSCLKAIKSGDWDGAVGLLGGFAFEKLRPYRGNEGLREQIQNIRKQCRGRIKGLAEKGFSATRKDFEEDMADLAPKIRVLFDLVLSFSNAFSQAKARKKRLDFSDLEHLALSLLVTREESGSLVKTDQAHALESSYEAVLVDEYQDVNQVQEHIFTSVSRSQQNLFLVGDAKQSIYSFRLATPDLFLARKQAAHPYHTGRFPARISLDVNFRSREEVTGAVNYLFSLLMSSRFGDIEYTGEELLRCGADYPAYDRCAPELLLLDAATYQGEKDRIQLEAELVAEKIAGLLEGGYQVTEGGALRPARPGDVCILMRSPRNRLQTYVKALERKGLPVWAQSADSFLEVREVAMVVSLLQALDNPLNDLPLAGALLSPLFDFTDTQMAEIRVAGKGLPFFRAVQITSEGGGETAAKCREFLGCFHKLRTQAAVLSADKLLLEIYALTGALELVKAMPMGESRRANLLLLVEYAHDYHTLGYKQLSGFVGFLHRLRERGGDLRSAGLTGESANAVKIMSVHRSKGLEFPIVFLADTAKLFNFSDLNQSYQFHSKYGFACARREPGTLKQYPTLPMQAIRIESRRSMLGEELRVLYVALTRAREKLIITACTGNNPESRLSGLSSEVSDGKLSPNALEEIRCPADWLLAALLHHPGGAALREAGGLHEVEILSDHTPWTVEVLQPPADPAEEGAAAEPARTAQPDKALLERLYKAADWQYPHAAQTRIPTKMAVSQAAKGEREAALYRFAARPKFMEARGLTAAERGNAMHKFMQFADYHRARDDLPGEIDRMTALKFLTQTEGESLDRKKLGEFFHGALGGRIFAADKVWRELRFLGECDRTVLGHVIEGMDRESRVALQGVADCVFLECGHAVIVDYKTDFVKTPQELLERYREQLRLYKVILSEALEVPVGECLIYSFALGRDIAVC